MSLPKNGFWVQTIMMIVVKSLSKCAYCAWQSGLYSDEIDCTSMQSFQNLLKITSDILIVEKID